MGLAKKVMRLKADCSRHAFQAFAPSVPSSLFASSSSFRLRNPDMDKPVVSSLVLSNPFASKTLVKSRSFNKISRGNLIRRSISLNLDEEPSSFYIEGSAKNSNLREEEEGRRRHRKRHCSVSKNSSSSFLGGQGEDQDSFLHSRFDFLEPMMLGIQPEFPDWDSPHEELATSATVERKAKSLDIPLSLRIIKKKLQLEQDFYKGSDSDAEFCSIKSAFASMVFIIVELQTCALHMREALCDENLEIITSKVQKEMHLSFVWLFQKVFSRTPVLMLHVMMLLANFGVHSVSAIEKEGSLFVESMNALSAENGPDGHSQEISSSLLSVEEKMEAENLKESVVEHPIIYPGDELLSEEEMNLWNSMVDDATKMREGSEHGGVDPETMQIFVSPVSVEVEADSYQDFLRTDLLYQMNLTQEPDNALLLCNYAQFLHLVAHDYHRLIPSSFAFDYIYDTTTLCQII